MQVGIKNTATLKYREVLTIVAKAVFEGNLVDMIDKVPTTIHKDGDVPRFYPTIETERDVLYDHLVTIMGHIVPGTTKPPLPLHEYAKQALSRKVKDYTPKMTVINSACNRCNQTRYFITNACQGCVARPCITNCPKKAISRIDRVAKIDPKLCIACGLCARNCPYGAVVRRKVPCAMDCPVDAIIKNDDGSSTINPDKCIHCGRCTIRCPFNAIMMPSQIVDVCKHITSGSRVYALCAPATLAQFVGTPAQLNNACAAIGFTEMIEVGLGADTTSITEAAEFIEHVGGGKQPLMTTSCCPAFVRALKVHVPKMAVYTSTTKSPMGYAGDLVKKRDREKVLASGGSLQPCVTVFVGPCVAKRREALQHETIDYVITAEELLCLFNAKNIDVSKMSKDDNALRSTRLPSNESTHYCTTQAVTLAVVHAVPKAIEKIKNEEREKQEKEKEATPGFSLISGEDKRVELKPVFISPLDKASFKQLKAWGEDLSSCPGNLIECMCCEGGCIGGPGNIINPTMGVGRIKRLLPERPNFRDIEDVCALK